MPKPTLDYLNKVPIKISWKVVAGGELHPIQMYDIVFDEYDFRIRQMEKRCLKKL